MEHVFLGIHFPAPRNYERVRVDDVNFNQNCEELLKKFRELTSNKDDDVSLVFLGNVLEDNEPMNRYNLRVGSTVHVLRKTIDGEPKHYKSFNELDVSRICSMYRSLNSGNFHKISRPEVPKMIFEAHPELKKDVIAMSILKDPILLSNLQNPDTVRKLAQHHRVFIEASETIVKALKSAKNLADPSPAPVQPIIDDLSDSSSSSSGSENNSPQASNSNMGRRITQDFLRQSIAAAQGRNSLANISQRNLNQGSTGSSNPISPSTSSGSVPAGHRFISSSMFMNAMNEVLLANRRTSTNPVSADAPQDDAAPAIAPAETEPTPADEERMEEDQAAQDERDVEMIRSFQNQLQQMADMGLQNKAQNVQALMVCNGNLEAAVNLVLAEMNNDMS